MSTEVLVIGDSISSDSASSGTSAYLYRLEAMLGEPWHVSKGSAGGWKVNDMRQSYLASHKETGKGWCVILGGVNDINAGTSAVSTTRDMWELLAEVTFDGCQPLVLLPTPVGGFWDATPQRAEQYALYRQQLEWLLATKGIPYRDTYPALGDGNSPPGLRPEFREDFVHLNAAGREALALVARGFFP